MLTNMAFRLHMLARSVISPSVLGVSGAVFDGEAGFCWSATAIRRGWHLPSGGVGRGEHPDAAMRRELAEELGLSGGTVRFVGFYARKAGWVSAPVVFTGSRWDGEFPAQSGSAGHLFRRSLGAAAGHGARGTCGGWRSWPASAKSRLIGELAFCRRLP